MSDGERAMSYWNRRSVAVLGVPFDNVTMNEAMDLIEEKIDERGFHQVATANVDFVMHAINDQGLQEMLCSCDLIVPDGMPVVWASRLMGAGLKERVSGVDLIPRIAALAARRGYGVFLLGASEQSSRRAAEVLQERFPKLRIVGRCSPPLSPLEDMDHERILSRIERARPHILLVAMGHPKQEQWLAMHRHRLTVPLCMGIGASLDFLSGTASRAPVWMQKSGLEWLYRVAQEPGRLTKRYLKDAITLARHLPVQVAANAIQPRNVKNSAVQTEGRDNCSIITIRGSLTGSLLTEFEVQLGRAVQDNRHVVLDLSQTAYLGLDSVGFLTHFGKMMKRRRRHLWLSAMPTHLMRVFRAARMSHYFACTSSVSDAVYRINKSENRLYSDVFEVVEFPSPARDVKVRAEMLKDLCRRIVSVSQDTRRTSAHTSARASAVRP
jgi:N-acetylglucosaminyldiphosphoundecaprenol N-acetyl-beta-D-mannosaminyltransferase